MGTDITKLLCHLQAGADAGADAEPISADPVKPGTVDVKKD